MRRDVNCVPDTRVHGGVFLSSSSVVYKSWGTIKDTADKGFIDVRRIRNIRSHVPQLSGALIKGLFR